MPEPSGKTAQGGGPLPPFPGPGRTPGSRPLLGKRHATLLALAGAVILTTLSALLVFPRHGARMQRPRPESQPAHLDTAVVVVKPGEVLSVLLSRAEISQPDLNRIVPALRDAGFNMRALRPGDSLFVLTREDTLHQLLYSRNFENVYRVDLDSGACRVSMLFRYIRRVPHVVVGSIGTSLYQSLIDMDEGLSLVADYADIFGWEVDFFTEPQPGDSFAILVERKYADSTLVGYGAILAAGYSGQVGRFHGFRFEDPDGFTDYYNRDGQSLRKTFLKSPLRFSRVSSFFGRRFHPIRRVVRQHSGVDYVAPTGTPVECVADGRVVSAGWSGGYGRLVEVGHKDGYVTRYGHLSGFARGIRTGSPLAQGQVIGYVGSTGLSTGPHLHYEVRKFGSAVNPFRLNPPRAAPVKLAYQARFQAVRDSLTQLMTRPATRLQPPPARAPK